VYVISDPNAIWVGVSLCDLSRWRDWGAIKEKKLCFGLLLLAELPTDTAKLCMLFPTHPANGIGAQIKKAMLWFADIIGITNLP